MLQSSRRWATSVITAAIMISGVVATAPNASANNNWGKVYKNVWYSGAPTYFYSASPDGYGPPRGKYGNIESIRAGYLNSGSNYFYCQTWGDTISVSGYSNNWWLLTDDDAGHNDVWVNAVYISGGGDYEAVGGVPYC